MRDVVVDTETYGNTPGSMILSIGAVAMGPDGVADEGFYVVVHQGGKEFGLHKDEGTVEWWRKQDADARQVLAQCQIAAQSVPLPWALDMLDLYVYEHGASNCRVWGCGSDFDNALLRAAYRAVDVNREPMWAFWNNRCYRTLKSLFPMTGVNRVGHHHNALDDARTEAEHAVRLLNRIEGAWL